MKKSLERDNIWKMQGLTFRCSAGRCEDSQASVQQVPQCIERCRAPLAHHLWSHHFCDMRCSCPSSGTLSFY